MSLPALAARNRTRWIRFASAAAAGLVAATAYPPVGFGPMIVVGVGVLVWLWRLSTPGEAAAFGFAWGLTFFSGVMYWIVYFGAVAMLPLMGALAATIALVGVVVGTLRLHGVHSAWLTAAVWTLVEFVRDRFPLGGLPWADTGAALADVGPARDLARWGGVTFVTFLVVLVAGLMVTAIGSIADRSGRRDLLGAVAGLGAVLAVTILAVLTASVGPVVAELRFAMLQGNDLNRGLTSRELADRYLPASHFALADTLTGQYDLIVFPESSMDRDPRQDQYLADEIRRVATQHDAYVLVNAGVDERDGNSYNMNLLYAPDGSLVETYAKQHLVPFGEYLPFEGLLSWIPETEQITTDYSPGEENVLFDVGGVSLATIICFENAFPDVARDAARDGAEAIVVTTNNRSYRRSSNAAQHVALSQMRAAETGRPVLHASISGITAIVDPDGSVVERSELFVNGVTEGTIATRTGETPYVRYGNWIVLVSLGIVAGAVALLLRRRASSGDRTVESSAL